MKQERKNEREQDLLSRLAIVQKMSVTEAMELLQISESTARRLFVKLENEGQVIRTHGGIRALGHGISRYSFEEVAKSRIREKTAIARRACQLLRDGDVIFCDSGTTVQCFCAALVQRLQHEKLDITVYTNSLANLEILPSNVTVNLVGGEYRANRKDFCGYIAEQTLSVLYFTKSFLGADGCVDGKIFTATDFETTRMNEIVIRNSTQTYTLLDSSKFSQSSHVRYALADELKAVVVDDRIDPVVLQKLRQNDVEVICAAVDDVTV